ncbi:MAG: hypothetical protein ACYS8W_20600 [Planctomycetota bacterium]|jgi:hypothetical protein
MEVTDIQIKELWEKERIDFDYEAKLYEWLGYVQKLDLRGVGKITLVNFSSKNEEEDNRSNYFEKERGTPAYIELCIERIVQDLPEEKKDDAVFLGTHIAFELFRQVGKNSLQFKHGIGKEKHEGHMIGYAKRILKDKFPGWKVEEGLPVKE